MPRKIEKKEREVFEKVPGSDIWWIRYQDAEGREYRRRLAFAGTPSSFTNSENRCIPRCEAAREHEAQGS